MRASTLLIWLACVTALTISSSTAQSTETKEATKLTQIIGERYADDSKDLTASASDRTFHISKEYGQPGYGTGLYGTYPGIGGNSIYGSGYRGTGLSPGYRGYPVGSGGVIGGGQIGYGYPSYSGYGVNNAYGGYNGYRGYGGYGGFGGYGSGVSGNGGYGYGYGPYSTSSYGLGSYDDGYGNRNGYGRYGGWDANGYGGYDGYSGSNYGSSYNVRGTYDPYNYRGNSYGSYAGYPSGYRGYS